MVKEEDIEKIIEWCEKKKQERKSIYIIERNPFAMEMEWTRNIINIEIDRPLSLAAKTSLVYDSVTKRLYQYINYSWMVLNTPDKK